MELSNSQYVNNPEKVLYNPIWDNIANNLGKGSLTLSDGDMYVCNYEKEDLFFYFEIKKQGTYMKKRGQFTIHKIIDNALCNDPSCNYVGFYILWYLGPRGVTVNYKDELCWDKFYKFLFGNLTIEPFDIKKSMMKNGWM